jgi:hypothetical protein
MVDSAARRASARHRPPARVVVPAPSTAPLCVGCVSSLSVEGDVPAQSVARRSTLGWFSVYEAGPHIRL